jgi:predicted ATPase
MIEQATGGKTLPAEVVQQIVAKTDGVPLFVEELTKMVLESELLTETSGHYELRGPLPPLAIPCTLQDSLMARLDRLATTKEIAQIGATLGREFSYDLLHAVSPVEENTLRQGLSQLVAAELLYQRGVPPQSSYLFKHALIQDTAYHSLLKSRRQQLHQQIAQALEDRFPDTKATQPELLAHHYTEAGLIAHAVPYWRQAGQNAIQRSAYLEAINHLTKGLEVLKTLPDTPERVWQELALQLALGPALLAAKGWTVPEVEQAYTRAQELGQQVGAASQLLPALWGLWVFHSMRGEVRKGRELGQKLLTLAQNIQDPAPRLVAHMALGYNSYHLGDIVSARDHLEQSAALYDPQQHHALASLYGGADPQVLVLSITAWTLWMLGYPDRALETVHKAGTLARELSHPHSLAFALCFAVELLSFRREAQIAHEQAETTIALCREQEFPFWLERVSITQGWALAGLGQGEDGIRQIRQSLAAYQARGAELFRPYFLALLAEAYIKVGQLEEGSAVLSEALALVDRTEERWYEGELYRLKGELLLKKSESRIQKSESSPEFSIPNTQHLILSTRAEVEGCFWRAIEIARQQQAKSLELRATVSLTRLWQQQGRRQEARTLLAEIYGWFTEGFDTKDLQEAKALLTELAEGV